MTQNEALFGVTAFWVEYYRALEVFDQENSGISYSAIGIDTPLDFVGN